jgi:perosamine synthetase
MFKDFPLMNDKKGSIPLFYPHIPKKGYLAIKKVLSGRWIGQGPLVDKFEKQFSHKFCAKYSTVAVGSGTDALHLSFLLADIKKNDEVICPVFTCTATNIPLLYIGAKIKFADIDQETMNISISSVKKLITKKTKAIVFVNYGGLPCDLKSLKKLAKKYDLKLIQDAAQSLHSTYDKKSIVEYSDFTIFSFQAIKHISSGDGGLLCIKDKKLLKKALRMRWFGIDRLKKQGGTWENDIKEVGYKYQMTDLGAALLIESLKEYSKIKNHRKKIFEIYEKKLSKNKNIKIVNKNGNFTHSHWLFTILTEKKDYLQKKLREKNIETNQVHFRNDRYSIFKKFKNRSFFKNMNIIENKYLVLPVHTRMSLSDANYVADNINLILK